MENKDNKPNPPFQQADKEDETDFPGYPEYPEGEDIYDKFKEEYDVDPENITGTKQLNEKSYSGKNNEKDFKEDKSGSDLDVPGSESDDLQEQAGNGDEENSYYSLGGDDHNDLDEDKGD